LSETLTKWGNGNLMVTQSDPSAFGRLGGYFDVVLIDAPCSGEGMFRDQVARDEWSVENASHCSERQKRILMDIWPALKENGVLIYSTCTFNPEENEKNISWLVEQKKAGCLNLNITEFPGIQEIEYQGITGYGFYPDRIRGNGFFISVIRKLEYSNFKVARHSGKTENPVTKNDQRIAGEWSAFSPDNLFRIGNDIIGLPTHSDDFLFLKKNLRLIKGGTHLFTVKTDRYLPSHELVLSSYYKNGSLPVASLDYEKAIAFLRRDNIVFSGLSKGWYLIRYDGVNLGLINNIGTRANNYYPVEWRIRMEKAKPGEENLLKWVTEIN
jgi:NOL1/NOP2/fmu family ribosome biogenesis protein